MPKNQKSGLHHFSMWLISPRARFLAVWNIPLLIYKTQWNIPRSDVFNQQLRLGMTDAEGIERQWANLGPVATTTREMGPGYRHDTLDDHMANWNWQKIVRLGEWQILRMPSQTRN